MPSTRFLVQAGTLIACLAVPLPSTAHEVYVSSEKDNLISVIDTRTLEIVRTFKVGKRPRGIAFSRDFSRLYVCASDSNAVQVFETSSGGASSRSPVG